MIKASELRIGNVVLYKPYGNRDGERVKIAGLLGMQAFFNKHTNESGMFFNLVPIPLTPEILEKCRFELIRQEYFLKDGIGIQQRDNEGYYLIEVQAYDEYLIYIGKPFQHLHQLQNLFFALTGEELNVQL